MTIKNLCNLLIADCWENVHPREFRSFSSLTGKENWFTALRHFKNYAYERNVSGAARQYREMAAEAIACLETEGLVSCDNKKEKEIWEHFKAACENKKIKFNSKFDPLNESHGLKKNLVRFASEVSNSDGTVAAWAFRMISENKLKGAHDSLKTVWGIGDKIASLYLRDIFWLGHNLNPEVSVNDDYLLQPVDIWVRRAAEELTHKKESARSAAGVVSCFEKENCIPHGGGNIAFWMLGAKYLDDEEQFRNVIKAIGDKNAHASECALSIARRFKNFGATLEEVIVVR